MSQLINPAMQAKTSGTLNAIKIIAACAISTALLASFTAQAGQPDVRWSVSVGFPAPQQVVVYPSPQVVYQTPQVVYQTPQVVYQQPQVIYQPAPVVVYQQPQVVYQQPVVVYRPYPPAPVVIAPAYPVYYNPRGYYGHGGHGYYQDGRGYRGHGNGHGHGQHHNSRASFNLRVSG